jgi:hypothetical protein
MIEHATDEVGDADGGPPAQLAPTRGASALKKRLRRRRSFPLGRALA